MKNKYDGTLYYWIWDSIQNASLKSMRKKKLYSLMVNNYKVLKDVLDNDELEELKESIIVVREMSEKEVEVEVSLTKKFYMN